MKKPELEKDILSELVTIEENKNENTKTSKIKKQKTKNKAQRKIEKLKKQLKYIWTIFKNFFIGFTKYALSSVLIFGCLMVITNYSAYYNIAKSYVFAEKIEIAEKGIIESVAASNLSEEKKDTKKENTKASIPNIIDTSTSHTDYSVSKLIHIANKEEIPLNIEVTPAENRIIIPKIAQNIPIVNIKNRIITGQAELNDIFMEELEGGVVRYPSSGVPGEIGNAFIFGHSSNFPWIKGEYNDVFALLDNVDFDDEIIVYYNQKKHIYKVKEKQVIRPGDVGVLKGESSKSEITIMTCWPIGTTLNRLIVKGELVEANNS